MSEDVGPSLHVWSVFDGHGQDGHHVSKYCREKFVNIWLDHDQHMPKAFKTMQVGSESGCSWDCNIVRYSNDRSQVL